MDALYALPFSGLLRPPQLKIKMPSLASLADSRPSENTVFLAILLSYFLVTGGIIYGAEIGLKERERERRRERE